MSTKQSVRYDFGRCTVEHIRGKIYRQNMWNAGGMKEENPPTSQVVVRLKQSSNDQGDEALFELLDYEARDLANAILEELAAM